MRGSCGILVLTSVVLAASPAAGNESLATLFPLRAPITAGGSGLCRLELPVEVVGVCRADLADVRILDGAGREIPYLVDSPDATGAVAEVRYGAAPDVLAAERSREEVGDRVTIYHERYLLALPPPPEDAPIWDLVLDVSRREFVSLLDATAVGPDGDRSPIVTHGSVFRLPSAGAERLRFPVTERTATRLEVVLASEEPGYLEPRFELEANRALPEPRTSRVDLDAVEERQLAEATELVVDRPRGLVPRRLAVATSTGTFDRRVTVWDEGPGSEAEPLGAGEILRVAAVAPVEVLEIPLRAPHGDRLRVVVENRDSPPLEDLAVAALLPRPVLVFSLPEGTTAATLVFGGGRAHRPSYDIAAFDPQRRLPMTGGAARRALTVLDPASARPATLGVVEPNPGFDPAPVLAFAMHPGATIDGRRFEYRRRLVVAPSVEGLSRLGLEPSDLALLRPDLADLRIVDRDGRQWAYLRQDRARAVISPLVVAGTRRDRRTSRYRIEIPAGALAVDRIELEAEAPYYDRDFVLRGRLEDESTRELARGRLVRRAGDPRPSTVAVEPVRVARFELEITDGDDAPLVFRTAAAWSLAPDLYLAATAGEYDLLLGDPEAEPPVYELERIRSTILAVPAAEAVIGELASNPAFSAGSRLAGAATLQKVALWVVLGLAVVVLVVLTLRAARERPES